MPEAGELESIEDVARVCEAMGLEETTADYPGPLAPRERVWDGIHATVKAGDYGGILEVRVLGPGSRWQCVVRYRHPAALLRAALTAAGEALAAAASPSGDTADLNPDPRTERGPWEGSPDAGQTPATPPPTALVSTILDSFRSHPAGTWETLAEHVASTLIAEGFVRAGSASPSGDTGQDRATEIDWPRQSTCRHCGEEIDFNEEEGEWWSDSDDVCGTDLDRDHEPLASASPSGDTGQEAER